QAAYGATSFRHAAGSLQMGAGRRGAEMQRSSTHTPAPGRTRRAWAWLRWGTVVLLVAVLALDLLFPPPLPGERGTATVVAAADGTPLRAFADGEGVWRHPATVDSVSPLY